MKNCKSFKDHENNLCKIGNKVLVIKESMYHNIGEILQVKEIEHYGKNGTYVLFNESKNSFDTINSKDLKKIN